MKLEEYEELMQKPELIRNICVVGPSGHGKTSVVKILRTSGKEIQFPSIEEDDEDAEDISLAEGEDTNEPGVPTLKAT